MNWIIRNERFDNSGLMVNIEFSPKNDALRYCLTQVALTKYPEFIRNISDSSSIGYEFVHFKNFKDMDWEDKAWAKNIKGSDLKEGEMFLVHDVMGETIIDEELFDKILFEYSTELMRVYTGDSTLQNNWSTEMQNALGDLKRKIDHNRENTIDYTELLKITDAFQIASGQGYAIEKTKTLLDVIKNGYTLVIENFQELGANKIVSSVDELADIFKSIDEYIDLKEEAALKKYFK